MGWSGKASGKGRFERRLEGDEGVRQVGVPAGGEEHLKLDLQNSGR